MTARRTWPAKPYGGPGLPTGSRQLLDASRAAWAKRWEVCDIEIDGDDEAQLAVRFNMYHLIIAAPMEDERVNIGAKTLSGFGYRAHAFWDTEIFMLPFFIYTQPHIARNLLNYRWHNLPGAHKKALATASGAPSSLGSPPTRARRYARPGCSDPTRAS